MNKKNIFVPFDKGHKLPPERKYVLVQLPGDETEGRAPTVAVGYLKYAAGDHESPYFVTPGVGGKPTHWNDCLGEDFKEPLWKKP